MNSIIYNLRMIVISLSFGILCFATCSAAEHVKFAEATKISEAVRIFNEKYSTQLRRLSQPLLSEDEIMNSLLLAHNGWIWGKTELSNRCGKWYRQKTLPDMSYLYIVEKARIRSAAGEMKEDEVFGIYLLVSLNPIDESSGPASKKQIDSAEYLPVRICKRINSRTGQ